MRRFPNDHLVVDGYTELLIQFGEIEKAAEMIQKSIALNPNKEGRKYFNLAEMLKGQEALDVYEKGIQVLKSDIESWKVAGKL